MDAADTGTPPVISCQVEAERSRGSINLRGKIISISPASGRYSFEMKKEGKSGSSSIQQSGNFSLSVGETVEAGQSKTDFGRGTRVRARLIGEGLGQKFSCDFDEISE
jgi:hypothetical protein